MSDPWGNDTATPSGFNPQVVEGLIKELEDAAAQFQKFYEALGTRFDTSELRTKMRDFRRRNNQTIASLKAHIEAPAKGAEQQKADLAQRIASTLQKLFAIEQLCATKENEIVTVMRQSISSGKPPEEVGRTLQLTQSIQLKEINVDEELVKERNEDLNRINKDVAELAELQKDVGVLINEQGENLRTAEKNTDNAKADIETGVENTSKASEYLASYRCKIFIIIIVLLVVAAIIIGIAVGVTQRNNGNPPPPPAAR